MLIHVVSAFVIPVMCLVFICFLAVSFKLTNMYYIAMLKHLFLTTFFVLQFESLQSQHEKLEKQAVTVQARLTNLQVCFIVTEVQLNKSAQKKRLNLVKCQSCNQHSIFYCFQRKQEFDQRQKEMEISMGNAVPKQQKPKEAEEKTKQRVQKVLHFVSK